MENLFFTSDTHFCHSRIIESCHRPFQSVEEMNEILIQNWNKMVGEHDIVYHLGDFCLGNHRDWKRIVSRLNGRIHLIAGNHDWNHLSLEVQGLFDEVSAQKLLKVGAVSIYLNHYPFLSYSGSDRGNVWQCFGHMHTMKSGHAGVDAERLPLLLPTQYDVGVDNNDFSPVPFEELQRIIALQVENQGRALLRK